MRAFPAWRTAAAVGVAALWCVAGCTGEAPPPPAASTPPTTTTTTKPVLTLAQYQALLTGTEQAVRQRLDRVVSAKNLAEVDAARLELAAVLEAKDAELRKVEPPEAASGLAYELRLGEASNLREYDKPADVGKPNECGVPPVSEAQLVKAKKQIYWRMRGSGYEETIAKFAKAGLKYGEQLLPPEPADVPAAAERRARNGEIVQRGGPKGRGRLQITNGAESDAVIAAANGDPKNPQASIYVRAGSSATLTGLSGNYSVYFKTGTDWDGGRRGFTSACKFESFLEIFTADSNWRIDLRKSENGNALTNEVPAF
ncbi:hypothetical protein [Amycolatopsis minnesotensis]|uniref:Uncharacterized protein n=1 Tax=Amycolatopsis minnesotensis TaxID=337894 RepID=A0ABN2QM28_9PSEU